MSSEEIKELVKVLEDLRNKLLSINELKSALMYVSWSFSVLIFIILTFTHEFIISVPMNEIEIYVYWVIVIILMIYLNIKAVGSFYPALALKIPPQYFKKYRESYRRFSKYVIILWISAFILSNSLIPHIFNLTLHQIPDYTYPLCLLVALGLGNSLMSLLLYAVLRAKDVRPLICGLSLLVAIIPLPYIKGGLGICWSYVSVVISAVYLAVGILYIISSYTRIIGSKAS